MMLKIWLLTIAAAFTVACSDDDSPSADAPQEADAETHFGDSAVAPGLQGTDAESSRSADMDAGGGGSEAARTDDTLSALDGSASTAVESDAAIQSNDASITFQSALPRPSLPRPPIEGRLPADLWPPRE